jgi:hypothetical protein
MDRELRSDVVVPVVRTGDHHVVAEQAGQVGEVFVCRTGYEDVLGQVGLLPADSQL